MPDSIVVVSSDNWRDNGVFQAAMESDRAGWPDTVLTAWPEQPAGWYAAKWWRDTGGETVAAHSRSELLDALRAATMGFILCRHQDPDAMEAIALCDELGIFFRQAHEGAYPWPRGERITYISQVQRREELRATRRGGLHAA